MTKGTCIGPECTREVRRTKAKLCSAHDTQMRRNGELRPLKVFITGCWFDGCAERHKANGLCASHYAQQLRGKTLTELVDKRRHKPSYRNRRTADQIRARDEHGRKQCRTCDEWLHLDRYTLLASTADGVQASCKSCRLASNRKTRARNYGLTPQGHEDLFNAQGRRCAVCRSDKHGALSWHTDHDHACCPTGTQGCGNCVRGILCRACNLALGMTKDNPETLRALANYLEDHAAKGV